MNILIAANYGAPKSGNFVASLIALARRLRKDGNNVVLAFPQHKDWIEWFEDEDFNVHIYDPENKTIDEQFACLTEIIDTYRIDLIHLHFGMFRKAIIKHRKEIKNIKILVHDHMDLYVGTSYLLQRLGFVYISLIYLLKNISVITVNKQKRINYIFLKNKWFIPNGISLERYLTHSATREESRKELNLAPNEKVCFLLGWDLKRKGLDIALKAVRKCRETDKNIVLGIIGAGEYSPSDYARDFIVTEAGIEPEEPWIRYFSNHEDMFAVHRAVDVYISASRKEAFSYGLLEAISQNTPIVVSDIKGTKWSSQFSNSYFYPVEDYEKCSEAIFKALGNGRCESNFESVTERYSVDNWCDKIIDVYNKI